ncbi:hypothetical protein P5915_07155 [Acholeplasma manati]|nr:hypothetical protein [Paracholeplasma manati]
MMNIKKVKILDSQDKVVFKGPLSSLKFKTESIKKTSIELFNDDNPCIIHESYAIEQLANQAAQQLLSLNQNRLLIDEALIQLLSTMELEKYRNHTLELEVK